LGERHQRQYAAFAVIVGAQKDQHIFGGHDDHERPKDQRQHTQHRFAADQSALAANGGVQRLSEGVKRARANVAIDDARASERKRPERA
jgi:hypothetical protein